MHDKVAIEHADGERDFSTTLTSDAVRLRIRRAKAEKLQAIVRSIPDPKRRRAAEIEVEAELYEIKQAEEGLRSVMGHALGKK